ncbi:CLUMA_CG002130, isoform A [Clunio marinus]|uniref:CLUMA_CG002130, isoform A n=1 Tax=Clunio marinus TaxID=568069 RepID=A0A1J1HQ64_9DIPT|nr:CLUMA_CG002130, isoform A [Clunio marinus]
MRERTQLAHEKAKIEVFLNDSDPIRFHAQYGFHLTSTQCALNEISFLRLLLCHHQLHLRFSIPFY